MKRLFFIISIVGIILSGCNKDSSTPTTPATKTYTLTMTIKGQGQCEITPNKSAYDEGENVTLNANANQGWKFKDWEGSILTTDNPVLIKMDGNKTITAVFMQTYEPDISGKWGSVQGLINLELNQPSIYDSNFTGIMDAKLTTGDSVHYSVSGYNTSNTIKMNWNRSGYYQIHYTGAWQDNSTIIGKLEENGVEYDLDFVRVLGKIQMDKREKINIGQRIK